MSFPGPPGSNSSLPPRPPPSKVSGFKPAFPPSARQPAGPPASYAASSAPGNAAASHYGGAAGAAPAPSYQPYGNTPGAPMSAGAYSQSPSAYPYAQPPQQQGGVGGGYQQNYYGAQAAGTDAYASAPQIRNPFPLPSEQPKNEDYDPDMAAQIAQWQSAYAGNAKDGGQQQQPNGNRLGPGGTMGNNYNSNSAVGGYSAEAHNRASEAVNAASAAAAQAGGGDNKKKTVVRSGGGQKWTDDTLMEWDPSHLRLFVGNLAGETTDESLLKAFSRWKSLQKARVIRDKVTSKSKGFGFVSFSDPDEFFAAAKEMNGKYIQSHPVTVRKSTTEIKPQTVREGGGRHHGGKWGKNNKNRGGNNGGNRSGHGGGANARDGSEPRLGPSGGGVTKPGQKTKDGLRLLG